MSAPDPSPAPAPDPPSVMHVLLVTAAEDFNPPLQRSLLQRGFSVEVTNPAELPRRLVGPRWILIDGETSNGRAGVHLEHLKREQPRVRVAVLSRDGVAASVSRLAAPETAV